MIKTGHVTYSRATEVFIGMSRAYSMGPVFANPVQTRATVELSVAETQHVHADVHDTLGRRLKTVFDGFVDKQQAVTIQIDGSDVPSAVYVLQVTGSFFSTAQTIVMAR